MSFVQGVFARLTAISRRTWLFLAGSLLVLVLASGAIVYGWDYTNSPQFCGTTCHTMPPEYIAYQVSPHARVACVECHIGRTFVGNAFTRKAGDLMHVVRYSSNQYSFPLYATTMQPARESCEKCHWPEKFVNDKVVSIKHYSDNPDNSLSTTWLIMKTGGGTSREGLGFGIHWHIENPVNFIALDPLKQTIPWIEVTDSQGKRTVYTDAENPLTPDEIGKAEKYRMDCIDCHNRISHTFRSPTQAMDQALSLNRIDATIPMIHKKGIEVLGADYKNSDEANKAIDALDAVYQKEFSDYYQSNSSKIKAAVSYLKTVYQNLVFPTQDLSWTTHPDNIGHKDWPGCFRCHDGKHFSQDNKTAIRIECNICHTLPEVAKAGGPPPVISVVRTDEPASHRTTTWLAEHRTVFNASCQACHDTRNAGGNDNSSFCSNSACHANKWTFAGLNAPAIAKIFPPPVVPYAEPNVAAQKIPHPIGGNPDCQICHGFQSQVRPYPNDHAKRANETCLLCHQPSIPVPTPTAPPSPQATLIPGATRTATPPAAVSATPAQSGAPVAPTRASVNAAKALPASHAGRTACLTCHSSSVSGAPKPPADHQGRSDGTCVACHNPS